MAYATHSDIEARLGPAVYVQLTDDAGTGAADEATASEARLAAEGEVNSHLARRVAVPVDVAGHAELADVLRTVTVDLAVWRLFARRGMVPDAVQRQREAAMQWLGRIASGEVMLPSMQELPGNPAAGIAAAAVGAARVLTREEMRAW